MFDKKLHVNDKNWPIIKMPGLHADIRHRCNAEFIHREQNLIKDGNFIFLCVLPIGFWGISSLTNPVPMSTRSVLIDICILHILIQ